MQLRISEGSYTKRAKEMLVFHYFVSENYVKYKE